METSKTLIEVKNVCQEFHLTKGLLQSLRFEKGKLVKEDQKRGSFQSGRRKRLR